MKERTLEFLTFSIRPCIDALGLDGDIYARLEDGSGTMQIDGITLLNTEVLLLGTTMAETGLREVDDRPAMGYFQMEPFTYNDIWNNYLNANGNIIARINRICLLSGVRPPVDTLTWHERFAVCMARIHYYRQPGLIPDTVKEAAAYWKQEWNTPKGKGTVEHFMNAWEGR